MAKPGNPRMERGRGGRVEGDREGEREREAGREGGARAKPYNQLVIDKIANKISRTLGVMTKLTLSSEIHSQDHVQVTNCTRL